jgi:RimJ/RimL family protein N-acetyltransferase
MARSTGSRENARAASLIGTCSMKAPEHLETDRLLLRRPHAADAQAIFDRYASDREVTCYLGWPRHRSLEQTQAFMAFSDTRWDTTPAGPFLIELPGTGALLGSTGLDFEGPSVASTGYVLARDAWGQGYATEALSAMVELCQRLQVHRVYALCHHEHRASRRVLEKVGFLRERTPLTYGEFPNLEPTRQRVARYARQFPHA